MAKKRKRSETPRARKARAQGHCHVHTNRFACKDEFGQGTGKCGKCREEAGVEGLREMGRIVGASA